VASWAGLVKGGERGGGGPGWAREWAAVKGLDWVLVCWALGLGLPFLFLFSFLFLNKIKSN
jgi:hypothetical protein